MEEEEESCSSSPPLLPPTSIPPLLSLTWQEFSLHLFFLGASLERPPGWGGGGGGGGGGASLKVRLGGRILPVCEGLSHRPQLFSLSLFSRCFCLHFFVTLASCMRGREEENLCTNEKGTTPVKADKSKEATLLDTFSATPIGAGKCLHAACIFPCATLSPPFLRRCFFAISRLCSVSAAVALKEEATRNKRSPPWPPLRSPGAEEEEDDDGKVFDCLSSYNGGLCKGAKTSQKPEKVQIRRQGIVSCSVFQGKMKVLLPKRNRIYSIGYAITAWNQSSLLAGNVFCPRQS